MNAGNAASDSGYQTCLDAAYRYLGYRPRREFEVRARLRQRGFGSLSIEKALQELRAKGLLDDLAFARFWKENRESFSPRSAALLARELRTKGIAPHIVAEVTDDLDEEANAYRAAQKTARRLACNDYDRFGDGLASFLRRRGFDYDVIARVVDRLWHEKSIVPERACHSDT
jgi:regulatory protein